MTSGDIAAIVEAIDTLEDGVPIGGSSLTARDRVLAFGGSKDAAELARALVRLVVRATGNGNE